MVTRAEEAIQVQSLFDPEPDEFGGGLRRHPVDCLLQQSESGTIRARKKGWCCFCSIIKHLPTTSQTHHHISIALLGIQIRTYLFNTR